MILFRVRHWGQSNWALVSVNVPGDDVDENGLAASISSVIGSALGSSSLHVQMMNEEGEWEEVQ